MDKIKVNNQVVLMRKFVKQAKTHVINKCIKQRKMFENRKGDEDKLEKSKRKLERLLMEINILKKITPDSVSKRVLSKEKDWKVLLTEKSLPLEERCFAMLAVHPSVQAAVEKFHSENKELIPKIATLVKDWDQKCQRADKIKKHRKDKPFINEGKTIKNKNTFCDDAHIEKKHQDENEELLTDSLSFKGKIGEDEDNLQNIRSKLRAISMLNVKELQNPNKISAKNAESSSNLLPKNCALIEKDELEHSNPNCISESNVSEEELQFKKDDREATRHKKNYQEKNSPKNFSSNLKLKEIQKIPTNKEIKQELSSNDDYQSEKYVESRIDKDLINLQNINESKDNLESLRAESSPTKKFSNLNSNYPSFTPKPDSKNKVKAITMLDLNELQDLDEIPIENSNIDAGEEIVEDTGKQKKDPFFLREGETVSESDDDLDEKQNGGKQDSFKKKSFNNFNKRESKNESFHKPKFERENQRMHWQKSNYRENNFQIKNSERNSHFKRSFRSNNEFHKNKKFKPFTDRSKGKFNSKMYNENPKEKTFVQNLYKDSKKSDYSSKHSLNNSHKTDKIDDKPLHPSWEAKRKLKEAANAKFQGKRIVFKD